MEVTLKISDFLSQNEIVAVINLLDNNKLDDINKYLNEPERKANIEKKGVLVDYLYRQFCLYLQQ